MKRYSAFAELHSRLKLELPENLACQMPPFPPKAPLAKYRAAFLSKRRRQLQQWLTGVLLHPDIGGWDCVKKWVLHQSS